MYKNKNNLLKMNFSQLGTEYITKNIHLKCKPMTHCFAIIGGKGNHINLQKINITT